MACGKRFVFSRQLDKNALWYDYIFGKQTLAQLSEQYQISVSSVQRRLKEQKTVRIISSHKDVVVLMDTTYWGRNFGVLVFKDAHRKKILWRKFVRWAQGWRRLRPFCESRKKEIEKLTAN